jgi:hypothetical protein
LQNPSFLVEAQAELVVLKNMMTKELLSMEFEIVPFVGVGALRFGMTAKDVIVILGEAASNSKSYLGNKVEFRPETNDLLVTYDDNGLAIDFGFFPSERELSFKENKIFQMKGLDTLKEMLKYDSNPYEHLGIIYFLNLGIRLSGFHDDDFSQKSVTVSKKGRLDKISKEKYATRFKLPELKYSRCLREKH